MKRLLPSLSALATCFVTFTSVPAFATAYDDLRTRWAETLVATSASVNMADPVIATEVNARVKAGQDLFLSMETASGRTYLWNGLESTTDSSHITKTYKNLQVMAIALKYDAYATTHLSNASQFRSALLSGLDWMYTNRYRDNSTRYDNWFDWEIGTPQVLLNIVALLWDDLSTAQRDRYTKAVLSKVHSSLDYYGANGTSQLKIWSLLGVLRGNLAANGTAKDFLEEASNRVDSFLTVPFNSLHPTKNTKSGMYEDGSFIEHDQHAYTGGYGTAFLGDLVNVTYLLKGSAWQTDLNRVTNVVVPWVFDAYDPTMYKRVFFHSVQGRYVSRVGKTYDEIASAGSSVGQAVLRLIEVAPGYKEREQLRKLVREWSDSNTSATDLAGTVVHSSIHDYAHIIQFLSTIPPRGPLTAYKQYPWMNRAMAHRPGWAASVAMYNKDEVGGTRLLTTSNETLRQETLQGLHLSDGSLQVMNDDFGQYNLDYFKYVDWTRLPGTTVAAGYGIPMTTPEGESVPWEERHKNLSNWAGGVGVDEFGATGFELQPASTRWFGSFHARKAYFFFDEEIVCMGNDIRTTDSAETHRIQTVIENWKLNQQGTNTFTVDGVVKPTTSGWTEAMTNVTWASLQGMVPGTDMGYYLPTPGTVYGLREKRGGTYFLTLWSDHGVQPSGRSYGYVLLPNHNAAQTQAYAASAPLTILENSPDAQAVWKASIGVTSALFLKNQVKTVTVPGSSTAVMKSDKSAAVLVHKTAGAVKVGLSDPTWENTGTVNLEIWPSATGTITGVVSKDARITVVQTTPTLKLAINVNGAQGGTLSASFTTR
jgi:hyaluronate lyase